jgi:hypothetical protein
MKPPRRRKPLKSQLEQQARVDRATREERERACTTAAQTVLDLIGRGNDADRAILERARDHAEFVEIRAEVDAIAWELTMWHGVPRGGCVPARRTAPPTPFTPMAQRHAAQVVLDMVATRGLSVGVFLASHEHDYDAYCLAHIYVGHIGHKLAEMGATWPDTRKKADE